MKQKKLIFNFFVNRNWKKLTDSRKRAKILADNRKSYHPIETLSYFISLLSLQFTLWKIGEWFCNWNACFHENITKTRGVVKTSNLEVSLGRLPYHIKEMDKNEPYTCNTTIFNQSYYWLVTMSLPLLSSLFTAFYRLIG